MLKKTATMMATATAMPRMRRSCGRRRRLIARERTRGRTDSGGLRDEPFDQPPDERQVDRGVQPRDLRDPVEVHGEIGEPVLQSGGRLAVPGNQPVERVVLVAVYQDGVPCEVEARRPSPSGGVDDPEPICGDQDVVGLEVAVHEQALA